jgi:hypothetical protein
MSRYFCSLAVAILCAFTVTAQDTMSPTQDNKAVKAPLMTLKGTIKAEGDKYVFVNDKDAKSWDVMNPEELKGHEGHHVQLSAHVYADRNSIHVMSIKMLKGEGGPPTGDDPPKQPPRPPPPPPSN